MSSKGSNTNLALLVHHLPLWHLGELHGRGGGAKGRPGPVACTVEPGAFDLVVTGKRGETIPTEQDGSGVSSNITLVEDGKDHQEGYRKNYSPLNHPTSKKQNKKLTQ